jgi:hypothetical protein
MQTPLRPLLIWILKANLLVWITNALIFFVLYFSGHRLSTGSYFSLVLLFETGIFLLVGGALAFSGAALQHKTKEQIFKLDDPWSIEKLKSSEKRANKYLMLAAILFVECLIVSVLGV